MSSAPDLADTLSQFASLYRSGKTGGQDAAADAASCPPCIAAGIIWWLGDLNPWRGPLDAMAAGIRAGPPRR